MCPEQTRLLHAAWPEQETRQRSCPFTLRRSHGPSGSAPGDRGKARAESRRGGAEWGVGETRTHSQLLLGDYVPSARRVTQVWAASFSYLSEPAPVTVFVIRPPHPGTWKTCQNYHGWKNKTDRREIFLKYYSAKSDIIHYLPRSRAGRNFPWLTLPWSLTHWLTILGIPL